MEQKVRIPLSIKIFTTILICAGSFFGYVYTFNPGLAFAGMQITDISSQFGFGSAGVRVFGSVFALIISLVLNNPRFLLITIVSRIFIELGDVILGLTLFGITGNTYGLLILAVLEIWAVIGLYKAIRKN